MVCSLKLSTHELFPNGFLPLLHLTRLFLQPGFFSNSWKLDGSFLHAKPSVSCRFEFDPQTWYDIGGCDLDFHLLALVLEKCVALFWEIIAFFVKLTGTEE